MESTQFRKYSIWGQIGFWFMLFMVMFMADAPYVGVLSAAIYALNLVVAEIGLVYTHYHFVFPFFVKGKKALYFPLALLCIVFFSSFSYFYDAAMPYEYDGEDYETFWESFSYTFPISILLVAGSSAYYFVEAWYKNIRKEGLLRNEKLEAELNFLKSQINPHFLFNTLNNIYSYVQTGNEKSAPMLERLSSVLRFMVYDCSEEKVELSKELEAVDDLLEIYKMKNSGQQNIELISQGAKGFHLIAPLIIVNMVENACKHSDAVSNPKGFIRVELKVDETDRCICEIANTIKAHSNTENKYGGIGHSNVVKRLELQYGDNYQLENEEKEGVYRIKVSMPLERKV
ncbi:MAG: histidine kinase [Roseivirga sp.]|nr:histidine kinase [Roseivirga sp.]